MIDFYNKISENLSKNEIGKFGFNIDVMQIYTQMKTNVEINIETIPKEVMLCWHIHYRHRPPKIDDPINWKRIVSLMQINPESFYLPEVFTIDGVRKTIKFIENLA